MVYNIVYIHVYRMCIVLGVKYGNTGVYRGKYKGYVPSNIAPFSFPSTLVYIFSIASSAFLCSFALLKARVLGESVSSISAMPITFLSLYEIVPSYTRCV